MRRRLAWVVAVPLALALLAWGGSWVYVELIADEAPAALSLGDDPGGASPSASASASAPAGTPARTGTWTVAAGSQVGYRVDEVLFGRSVTAVGRTSEVSGELVLDGTRVSAAAFTVDMASVESDESRRDSQYRGRIMSTDRYPTSTFRLTGPIDLGRTPAAGETVTVSATGDLTLRGVTRPVTFDLRARRTGDRIEVNGSIPVRFDDWRIPSPSFGPAEVEDHGTLEFLLAFTPA